MKQFFALISLLMLSVTTTFAGTPLPWAKRNITVELGVGINYAPNTLIFDQVQTGWSGFVEPHYNFSTLQLSGTAGHRQVIITAEDGSECIGFFTLTD